MAKLPTYEEMGKKVAEEALDVIYGGKTIREWIEILVKQKPWEDCISRQAVMDAADKVIERDTSGNNDVVNAMIAWSAYIKSLPPVTPQPKPRTDILDKIRAEIEKAIWEDILPIFDEAGEITDEIRTPLLNPDDVFEIIDKYKAERED